MQILEINNYHYLRGGSERYFFDLISLLEEHGNMVRTLSVEHRKNMLVDKMIVAPPKGVKTEGIGSISNIARFIYSPSARKAVREALSQFKPDIIHLHIYYGQLSASILKPLHEYGAPIIQTLHEYKLVCPTHGLYAQGAYCDACKGKYFWNALRMRCNRGSFLRSSLSALEQYVSCYLGAEKIIDRFITPSEYQKRELIRLGVDGNKLRKLYHFIEPPKNISNHSGNYFLFVGRIVSDKGIGTLLKAFAAMNGKRPHLKIVGEGDELEFWKQQARKLDIDKEVSWLGFIDGVDLDTLYMKCLALINPSQLNETFGLTCIEGMARGRPVVASSVGAIPEVVSSGVDGLLVAPGNADELRAAMEYLAGDPTNAQAMGKKGLEKVCEKFSKEVHYKGLMKIYNEALYDKQKQYDSYYR